VVVDLANHHNAAGDFTIKIAGCRLRSMRFDDFDRRLSPRVKPAPSLAAAAAAGWLAARLLPLEPTATRVCSVVPGGFEAYARVLHPAFGRASGEERVAWHEAARMAGITVHAETQWETIVEALDVAGMQPPWMQDPIPGRCPPSIRAALSAILAEHTSTPELVWYALWTGFPDVESVAKEAARVALPGREYALVAGPVGAAASVIESASLLTPGPSLWWPDDRAWCVATEVDFRWTYVGGSKRCIRAVAADAGLEVQLTTPQHRGDIESDWTAPAD
jgi:hypothetical protein